MHRIKTHYTIKRLILWLVVAAGSTGVLLPHGLAQTPVVKKSERFVLVTATAQDNLTSLAERYLKDSNKAWWIADYNQIKTVTPGQQLVIPLIPTAIGGIKAGGYQTVPVLRYLHLAHQPTKTNSVSSRDFGRQMSYLVENDFITISLDHFHAFLNLEDQLPPNAVMVTFDTADRWVYDIAFPMIKQRGLRAVLFVPVEQIGQPGKLAGYQLARMAAGGFDIGAYGPKITSFDGKNLSRMTRSIDQYILQSKKAIERYLDTPCQDFSVPVKAINDLTTTLLKKHGFRTCYTAQKGQNPFFVHDFKIQRSVISGQDNLHQFGQNLRTFHKAQRQ